jgi:hypothetical protein
VRFQFKRPNYSNPPSVQPFGGAANGFHIVITTNSAAPPAQAQPTPVLAAPSPPQAAPAPAPAPAPPPWPTPDSGTYVASGSAGFASQADMLAGISNYTMTLKRCGPTAGTRAANVQLASVPADISPLTDIILLRAAQFVWSACPRLAASGGAYAYEIHEVDVLQPDGTLAVRARGLHDIGSEASGSRFAWRTVRDFIAEARTNASAQAAQAAQQQQATRASEEADAIANLWLLGELGAALCAVFLLFGYRHTLARWYYSLTPHPAARVVNEIIRSNAPLDANEFAHLLREIPGNPVEQEVRAEQARALAVRAQQYQVKVKQDLRRITDVAHAQADLDDATLALDTAQTELKAARRKAGIRT